MLPLMVSLASEKTSLLPSFLFVFQNTCLRKIELEQNLPQWEDTFRLVYVMTATQAKLWAAHLMQPALLHWGNRARFSHLNKDMLFPIAAQQAEFIANLPPGEQRPGTQACLSFIPVCCGIPTPAHSEIHTSKKWSPSRFVSRELPAYFLNPKAHIS